jgi:Xaa-Pro aminopeptidase
MATRPLSTAPRLDALRQALRGRGLTAYIVPTADPHQSEYPPAWWQRRAFISGFTGSQGTAVVGLSAAWLWADSRYWLQAEREIDPAAWLLMRAGAPGAPTFDEWLGRAFGPEDVLGVDPHVLSVDEERRWRKALAKAGARLELALPNLVDPVWADRPAPSLAPLTPLGTEFSGDAPASKLARLQEAMHEAGADALVVTMLDAVAWLFDVRGSDVEYNPVAVASALVRKDGASLFVDSRKVHDALRAHLPASVRVCDTEDFGTSLETLATSQARVWIEPSSASAWILSRLQGAAIHEERSPITLLKARKNGTELEGMRRSHVRDGVALVKFLHWLEGAVTRQSVTEIAAAGQLAAFRSEGEHFKGLSFETISAFGDHGAVVHYRPAEEGDRVVDGSSLYLIDSGAQYLDGTTDVTRTICLGAPTEAQREQFTRVLRGHVAIARAVFPQGTTGKHLDALARVPLWEAGLNFGHGTGHGVGAYLNVHEGPQRIAPKGEDVPLDPGMILSNEPGYYAAGSHGIRIESLVIVVERPGFGESETFLGFETITCCPLDRKLIDLDLLLPDEARWIDDHHRWVRETLSPLLADDERAWLARATEPLAPVT